MRGFQGDGAHSKTKREGLHFLICLRWAELILRLSILTTKQMPQLEIQYQTKIHDDLEFCHDQSEQCKWLKGEYCSLTGAFLKMERGFRKKGKECKKIYAKHQNKLSA